MRIETQTPMQLSEVSAKGLPDKTASTTSTGNTSLNDKDLIKLKMLLRQHLSPEQIARKLGKPVSAVMKQARLLGFKVSADSTSDSSTQNTNPSSPVTGSSVNVQV